MKVISLKPFIKPGIATFILMLVCYLGIWTVNVLLLPEFTNSGVSLRDNDWPVLYHLIALALLITLNSVLLRRFVLHFSIIRTKSFLPVFFFLTFTVVWSGMRTDLFPHIQLTLFLLSLELFFGMYRNRSAVEPAFLGSLLVAVTSLYHPFYLLLFPIIWIGWIILKSMSLRSWLASLTAIAIPWIFYNAWCWHRGIETTISPEFTQLTHPSATIDSLSQSFLIYSGALLFIGIICAIGLFSKLLDDSIQTRKNISLLVITVLFILAFSFFYPQSTRLFQPLTAFLTAVIMAHPFTLRKSLIYSLLFILFTVINLLYLFTQYFQLYY